MTDFHTLPTREAIVNWLAHAALSGYLGLFVGTGFSKAATDRRAPSFDELLRQLAIRLGLDSDLDNSPKYRRKSYPQVASQLLADYSDINPPREKADERFRDEIAQICNLYPSSAAASRLSAALGNVRPSWIITTNYDLILEALIEDAESVLPTQPLVPRSDRVPIYHLHGHRHNPTSLKITEEDYVGLLGPIDYQRLKLPLLLLESTTLLLGYAFGDINVRAAAEWSRSFRGGQGLRLNPPQGVVVQALYSPSFPPPEPRFGPNGEYILETADIADLLEEIATKRLELEQKIENVKTSIQDFLSDPKNALAVSADTESKSRFLNIIQNALPFSQPTRIVDFLSRALDPIWDEARKDYHFEYYDTYLELLLDIFEKIDHRTSPTLLSYLGDALDRVGWYIDPQKKVGSAFAATNTWMSSHRRLSEHLKRELRSYAEAYDRHGLKRMLELVE